MFLPHYLLFAPHAALALAFALLFLINPACANEPSNRVMFVFDASNSMWGQIDGVAKIETAREALSNAIGDLPDTGEVGLTVYGHRRQGDCSDIELMVPMQRNTKAKSGIPSLIKRIKPKGKTPLSEAVRTAADAMKYQEIPSTVVLITDGVETCQADPCALGNELERLGVNFTAHVIGFNLTRDEREQVACLADNTGGQYFSADNADQLKDALNNVVEVSEDDFIDDESSQLAERLYVVTYFPDKQNVPARLGAKSPSRLNSIPQPLIIQPDGTVAGDAKITSAMDKAVAKANGLNPLKAWNVNFRPMQEGTHIFRINYFGFSQEYPFEVTPVTPPLVEMRPDVTFVTSRMLDKSGKEMKFNYDRIALCPPDAESFIKENCIWTDKRSTYAPTGIYRAFNHRWYNFGKANKMVDINVNRGTQTITFILDETADPAQNKIEETSVEEPRGEANTATAGKDEQTQSGSQTANTNGNASQPGGGNSTTFIAKQDKRDVVTIKPAGPGVFIAQLYPNWCGKGEQVCGAATIELDSDPTKILELAGLIIMKDDEGVHELVMTVGPAGTGSMLVAGEKTVASGISFLPILLERKPEQKAANDKNNTNALEPLPAEQLGRRAIVKSVTGKQPRMKLFIPENKGRGYAVVDRASCGKGDDAAGFFCTHRGKVGYVSLLHESDGKEVYGFTFPSGGGTKLSLIREVKSGTGIENASLRILDASSGVSSEAVNLLVAPNKSKAGDFKL